MAIVEALAPGSDGRRRLGLRSPLGETPIGEITVATAEDVAEAIRRARIAQKAWAARTIEERAAIVNRAIDAFLAHQEDIIATLRAETGKTRAECVFMEILPACDFVNYWSARAPKDLADHKRKIHGYLRPLKRLEIVYRPLGVVGVITPWNGPFSLATNPTVQALLAGNAVLLKPSEVTPESSAWAVRCLHEAGVPKDVVQVLYGDGETGAALVRGGIDKISFTGSVRTGTKIGIACAEQLIPCTLELGGKDAMIVCADANVERAARGAVFNSMLNTGQVCMGVERVYVMNEIADEFERMVREQVKALRYGPGEDVDVGAVFWDKQLDIIKHHVEDARKRGATIDIGGEVDRTQGVFYKPTLVTNVTHEMEIMREETFGPIVAIMRVGSEAEAIRLANDSEYGLSASVWTKDIEKGIRIAKQIEAGSVCINDATLAYGVPEAPFGGLKKSGLGSVNGTGALRSYSHELPIVIDRWGLDKEEHWYPFTDKTLRNLEYTLKYVFGTKLRRFFS